MTEYLITFVGDTSFGENYRSRLNGEDLIKSKGRAYSLQGVAPLLLASDLVVANLETPLTQQKNSLLEGHKKYIHWSDPVESPRVLKEHNISVVSLANNHTVDCGIQALAETFESLEKNQIKWFGAGLTALDAQRPYRKKVTVGDKNLPLVVIGAFEYRSVYKHRYGFYANGDSPGVNRLTINRISNQIERLKSKTPQPFVIVYPHWGENYDWHSSEQALQARTMAEAGADLIVGHGAHMLGGIERIGAAWTLYSLGNLVFNSPGGYSKHNAPPYSLIACMRIKAEAEAISIELRLYPILTDNQLTDFQSRPVNEQEIIEIVQLMQSHSASVPIETFGLHHDRFGYYFEIPIW
ncbi:CapA family protein [Nitrosomonas sp.]|uniref:CapA family protein n=1 Tax=Nitrosomonas sp. TaxID=42353 RepID=UPI0025D4127C|nr:CapA family protein [Nitrosomonas sp.]